MKAARFTITKRGGPDGEAQETIAAEGEIKKENYWKTPAAWRAVVRDGKIAEWQVYADNEPARAGHAKTRSAH